MRLGKEKSVGVVEESGMVGEDTASRERSDGETTTGEPGWMTSERPGTAQENGLIGLR